jgi:hypothetical protein
MGGVTGDWPTLSLISNPEGAGGPDLRGEQLFRLSVMLTPSNWGCAPSRAFREGALGTVRTLELRIGSPTVLPKFKSPASQAGLKQLPVGTLLAKHS